ncbi:MAG: inorganic pyrophosphatase [Lysobacterales bacterium]
MSTRYALHRPHPWHGLSPGRRSPKVINVFVEMTPFDYVKYELDKETGFLCIDRPQRTTSQLPCLYGFMPQTYCAEEVHKLSPKSQRGDMDPLDICVISERPVARSEIVLKARVIGGLQMIDDDEADDKIVAVLEGDHIMNDAEDLTELPDIMTERLRHYFLTYKSPPDEPQRVSSIEPYGCEHAHEVVEAAIADYQRHFGTHGS